MTEVALTATGPVSIAVASAVLIAEVLTAADSIRVGLAGLTAAVLVVALRDLVGLPASVDLQVLADLRLALIRAGLAAASLTAVATIAVMTGDAVMIADAGTTVGDRTTDAPLREMTPGDVADQAVLLAGLRHSEFE